MRPRNSRTFLAISAIVVALVATGCSNQANPPGNHPSGNVPQPNVSSIKPPVVNPVVAPKPWVKLDCTTLVPKAMIDAGINGSVTLQPIELAQDYLLSDGLPADKQPTSFSIRQDRGLACEWSNGLPAIAESAENPAYVGIVINVLPNATTTWSAFQTIQTTNGTPNETCTYDDYAMGTTCQIDLFHNGYWLQARIDGLKVSNSASASAELAAAHVLTNKAFDSIDNATADSKAWVPATDTIPLKSENCDQFVSSTQMNAAVGYPLMAPAVSAASSDGTIYTQDAATWKQAGIQVCSWSTNETADTSQYDVSLLTWLPGGEWAFNEVKAAGKFGKEVPLAVPGLTGTESAGLDCTTEPTACQGDLVVGHDWIWFYVWSDPAGGHASATAAATAVAAAIVANLHAL